MTRILSGFVLVGAVLATVFLAPFWVLLTVLAIVGALGCREYGMLTAHAGDRPPLGVAVAATLGVGAAIAWPAVPMVPVLASAVIAAGLVSLARHQPAPHVPGAVAALLFPAFYLGVPLGLMATLRASHGPHGLLFVLVIVIVSDTAQYFVGSRFGRRRLAPVISPKKSVEGAVGGFVAAAATAVWYGPVALPGVPLAWLALAGLLMAGLGIAGDLFESLLKRSAGVKDSAQLIPGHGGILDRIDAMLFVVPGFYLFLRFVN